MRKHRNIKLFTTGQATNYLLSEPIYHITKFFTENLLAIEMQLINEGSEDRKAKDAKKFVTKRKPKFQNYRNCSEATEVVNKIKYLEKHKIHIDSLKKIIKNS